jgi:DNA polymerase iota
LLAKLVGNLHKPKGQTTLMPPYDVQTDDQDGLFVPASNVTTFIDSHEIGKIPGIGFKMAHKIRNHITSRLETFDAALVYEGKIDQIKVHDVRTHPDMSPQFLEKLLGGPGAQRGIGGKVWELIRGIDNTEVREVKKTPTQLSIEDSYGRLDNLTQLQKELQLLATTLIRRMHIDLLEEDDEEHESGQTKRWLAHPKTIRLSTRPRAPQNPDGSRSRSFARISRSAPMPNFFFSLKEEPEALVDKLVAEVLLPMFHRLHPERSWNLSLVNIAVTNMVEAASSDGSGGGRDISLMFKRQNDVLKEWKIEDRDIPPENSPDHISSGNGNLGSVSVTPTNVVQVTNPATAETQVNENGSEDMIATQHSIDWEDEVSSDENLDHGLRCPTCGVFMPSFAIAAHERFHEFGGV